MYPLSDTKLSRSDSHRRHLSVTTVALKCDSCEAWSKYHLSDTSNLSECLENYTQQDAPKPCLKTCLNRKFSQRLRGF
jgi:hypothetical protein